MQLPARIGKYELQEFLGGGMSHVYRAWDTVIGRAVAVKVLTEAACRDESARMRFLAEARMAGSIRHENVISLYDFGEDEEGRPFMVMEFLQGENLREAIAKARTGELKDRLRIALPIARALQCVHSNKLIHRDVKPENIHINTAGVVKLMDFGIAKTEGFSMTQVGFVLGTPYYMAPEQVLGHEISPQVDVYAFGILLFELLTATRPVSGDTVERIFYSILNQPLDLKPLDTEGMPAEIPALVAKCTAKKADDRPAGFGPVIAALEQAIGQMEGRTVTTAMPVPSRMLPTEALPRTSPPPAGGRPAYLLPVAALAGVLVLAAIYLVVRPKQTPSATESSATQSPAAKTAAAVLAPTLATTSGEMVLVPAGDFLFGEKKQKMSLPAFYIDRTEVTNRDYAAFCQATAHPLPDEFARAGADLPVVNVTVADAKAYAEWAGKRLPKEAEWEKAARGTDGQTFPWGGAKDASRANVRTRALRPANGYPQGASPYGALQMVGNAWEFIDQTGTPSGNTLGRFRSMKPPATRDEPWYMIRGQSFGEPLMADVIWDSTVVPARWKASNIGFRCAKDAR